MMDESLVELATYLKNKLGNKLEETVFAFGELTIVARLDAITDVLMFVRDDSHCQFINLTDISGVDYPSRDKRFDVSYQLLSPRENLRLRVKVRTDENTPVASACTVYPGAEWYERETYDMYGILFSGHPDLRRILTDYGFEGYPLRKDFPVTGFVECRYDNEAKRVIYEPVVLRQEMRNFDFLSPWEGGQYVLPCDGKEDEKK
ncbi:NADH-quinone oxidoreductase subunit C [Bartonella tribocorum]|uniref:NADH-quinone oxidoreductase subunit C n=1 Tax=Bartonella tribocorum (strain DSM 28219 / CCUG 45778 / CIP 105476 / IBS 506) TaxID=382640 RepID=NUOC_BART1|nr:NADH-quinone oxidoreductase subunit C [Bartonella tribocorum]A9IUQ0.1 RecName: Full=NADH-quinone oxidoreductase subunit C; AltName: Full=NADH dehydrogenase I subunit C; AltName: Full=NDH-1 subunit C [Bartonella tribocorum CIP 105476]CAK01585.1 NADH dehydrogenase I chain C [Bartonella tribocorum CIP 105476]CDO48831.1 NADH dehydrogenase subunit C [Bartonella tribocorum]